MRQVSHPGSVKLVLAALLLAGCDNVVGGGEPSFLVATIETGPTYHGDAEFHIGTPAPERQRFQLSSYQASNGASFAVTHWDGGRLDVGTYALGLVDLGLSDQPMRATGISLQYFDRQGDMEDQYVAESGVLEVTRSSPSRMEGTFTVTAVRYCRLSVTRTVAPQGECHTLPAVVPDGAVRLSVTGSFSATPLRTMPSQTRPGRSP